MPFRVDNFLIDVKSMTSGRWREVAAVDVSLPNGDAGILSLSHFMELAKSNELMSLCSEFNAKPGSTPVFRTNVGRFPCNLPIPWESFLRNVFIGVDFSRDGISKPGIKLTFEENCSPLFTVPLLSVTGKFIMNFEFQNVPLLTNADLIEKVADVFDISTSDVFVADIFGNVIAEMSSADLFSAIASKTLLLVCDLDDSVINNVKKRSHIVREFLDTEASYLDKLHILVEYIIPFLRENAILDGQLATRFEGFLQSLLIVHGTMISKVDSDCDPFFICMGQLLSEAAVDFSPYMEYSEMYNSIRTAWQQFDSDQVCHQLVEGLEKLAVFCGNDIKSFLFLPIQRLTKYGLFIDRCITATPVGHMDKPCLYSAREQFEDIRKEMNIKAVVEKSMANFEEQMSDLMDYVKLETGQGFVRRYNVIIENKKHALILLTDALMVGKIVDCKRPVFRVFRYLELNCEMIGELVVAIYASNLSYIMKFDSAQSASDFLTRVTDASVTTQIQEAKRNCGLSWKKIPIPLPKLQRHAMCEMQNKIWIFGGRNDKGNVTDAFMCVTPETKDVVTLDVSRPCARYDAQMCAFDDRLFLYGGVGTGGRLNDLWVYSQENGWMQIETPEDAPAGSGLSVVKFLDGLLVTGGRAQFVSYIYKPGSGSWIRCDDAGVPPVMGHCVAVIDDVAFLCGGCLTNDKMFKDIYVFRESNHLWVRENDKFTGLLPLPRIGHRMVPLSDRLWVIGGVGSGIPFLMTPTRHWLLLRNEGQVPATLSYFGIACHSNERLYIYGGRDEHGVTENIYEITIVRPELIGIRPHYSQTISSPSSV